jgi:hypothetical protein
MQVSVFLNAMILQQWYELTAKMVTGLLSNASEREAWYLETYWSMVLVVVFIHKLSWNHISAVLALLEIPGTMYAVQRNVRRWNFPLAVRTNREKECIISIHQNPTKAKLPCPVWPCHVLSYNNNSGNRREMNPRCRYG